MIGMSVQAEAPHRPGFSPELYDDVNIREGRSVSFSLPPSAMERGPLSNSKLARTGSQREGREAGVGFAQRQ